MKWRNLAEGGEFYAANKRGKAFSVNLKLLFYELEDSEKEKRSGEEEDSGHGNKWISLSLSLFFLHTHTKQVQVSLVPLNDLYNAHTHAESRRFLRKRDQRKFDYDKDVHYNLFFLVTDVHYNLIIGFGSLFSHGNCFKSKKKMSVFV